MQSCKAQLVLRLHPAALTGAGAPCGMPEFRQIKITLVVFIGLLLLFLLINLWMIAPFILALLMGGILATITHPLYYRLRERKIGRRSAAGLIILSILLLGIIPIGSLGTIAVRQGIALGERMTQGQTVTLDTVVAQISNWKLFRKMASPTQVQNQIRSTLKDFGSKSTDTLLSLLGGIPAKVLQIFFTLLTCFFMLLDGKRMLHWLADKLPMDLDVRQHVFRSFRDTAFAAILATLLSAAVQAGIILTAFILLGVPQALLAAGATFIFAWIPLIGSSPVWIAATIYLFVQSGVPQGFIMLAFGVVTALCDHFVRPLVLQGRNSMHPLVALVAITGAVNLFGFFGVFFGPVLAAILIALLEVWPVVARRFHLVWELPDEKAPAGPTGLTRQTAVDEARKRNAPRNR